MQKCIYKTLLFASFELCLPGLAAAQIVINEIQISPVTERFIELYNESGTTVDLTGWYLQRKTATGSSFGSLISNLNFDGKSIEPNDYFVISRSSSGNSDLVLGTLTLTESNAIQLKNSNGDIIDKIGWGDSTECLGSCPANPANSQSIQKTGKGWIVAGPTLGLANSSFVASDSTSTATSIANTQINDTGTNLSSSASGVYYSSVPLSTLKTEPMFELSAGRDRIGSVGSPLEFMVHTNIPYLKNVVFTWNFGDGSEGNGEALAHTYEYPGEYSVILNATFPQGRAIARASIKIIAPDLSITNASPERVEISNKSSHEVSLFGRVLVARGAIFVFPKDTIIKAGQSISFGSKVTGLQPLQVSDATFLVIGETEQAKITAKIEEEKVKEIVRLQDKITVLQSQLAALPRMPSPPSLPVVNAGPSQATTSSSFEEEVQTAVAVKSGWFGTIKKFLFRNK